VKLPLEIHEEKGHFF